jgi:hypothetical protein
MREELKSWPKVLFIIFLLWCFVKLSDSLGWFLGTIIFLSIFFSISNLFDYVKRSVKNE